MSVHTFWADPSRAWIIVSDASGTDGLGYYYGPLSSNTPPGPRRIVSRPRTVASSLPSGIS